MLMTKNSIFLFRLSLVLALIVITYLTTTSVEYSVAEQVSDKLSHALAFLGLSLLADFLFLLPGLAGKKSSRFFLTGYCSNVSSIFYLTEIFHYLTCLPMQLVLAYIFCLYSC
jgi:hypothetical protein